MDEKDIVMIKEVVEGVVEGAIEKNNYILQEKLRSEFREGLGNLRDELRTEFQDGLGNLRDELRTEFRENSESLREELRSEFRDGLGSLREEFRAELQENSRSLREEFRTELQENSRGLRDELREEIHSAINENNDLIFDEMDRYYRMTHKEIEALDKKVTEISDYYRIRKLEDDNSSKALRLYEKQQEEIDEIKRKLAM